MDVISSTQKSRPRSAVRPPFLHATVVLAILLLATCAWAVQSKSAGPSSAPAGAQAKRPRSAATAKTPAQHQAVKGEDWQKYSAVITELIKFQAKLQQELQFPALRSQSRLLPLLPDSTLAVGAFPNYGTTLHQATLAFQREREENATLREWWKNDVGADGQHIDDVLDRLYQASQYLGDEVVVSATSRGTTPVPLIFAEVKKPGLKAFLQQANQDLSKTPSPSVRFMDPAELAGAAPTSGAVTHGATDHGDETIVLVRPDFVVVGFDLESLRAFNILLEKHAAGFPFTPFGQRLMQAYQGGAGVVAGADLHKILDLVPMKQDKDRASFQRTGFDDLKYIIWEHKDMASQSTSQAEITFNGPRRGIASWLANPQTLGGLDFISPKSAMVIALGLKSPALMFEDIKDLATASNPDALAMLPMMEAQFQVNLKQDLLSKLTGEIITEVDPSDNQVPAWKLALRVNDAAGLQQTLARLLAAQSIETTQAEEAGVVYHSFIVPSGPKPLDINYAFVDGYLLVGTGRKAVAEAVQFHRTGGSLAKSAELRSWLLPGHSSEASGFVYQNIAAMIAPMMGQMPPEMGGFVNQFYSSSKPTVMWVYGDDSAIREAHTGGSLEMSVVLLGAAIAIPNLLHARISANDAAGVASLRTVNTAEVTYQMTYPSKGYARNLAMMGPGAGTAADCSSSAAHACLLDETLGCAAGVWCTKSGYRFHVTGICPAAKCTNYVAVATPVSDSTGSKSYCSVSDAVVRTHTGQPVTAPISVAECRTWKPIF